MKSEIKTSSFAARVEKLLERVEYRVARTPEEKSAIYRMRYDAYRRSGAIEENPVGEFSDLFDDKPNVWLIGAHIDGELAGSLRLHVAKSPEMPLAVSYAFPDVINPLLEQGKTIVDPSRISSYLSWAREYPELVYVVIRASFIAEKYFNADFQTAAARVEHQAFYKRIWKCTPWSPAKTYPTMTMPIALLGYNCHTQRDAMYGRYPFLHSSVEEQKRLFEVSSNGLNAPAAFGLNQDTERDAVSADDSNQVSASRAA